MSENNKNLNKNELITVSVIFVVVLVLGLILMGLGLNEAFYSSSSTIRSIFKAITYLGEPIVFIVMVAVFYIIYDKKFAKNLALSLVFTVYLNEFFKDIFMDPRPATNVGGEVTADNPAGLEETSYGFPSGHTQSAIGTWGYIAYDFRKRLYIVIILGIIMFLVAISRMIVGVHDLQDVIGGFSIGLIVLLLFTYLEPYGTEKFNALNLPIKLIVIFVVSLVLFLLGIFLFPTSGTDLLPTPVAFTDTGSFSLVGGVLLGFGIAYILENEYVNYEPSKLDLKWKIINLVIGLVILFVVYFGLEAIRGLFDSVFYRFARYAIVGFVLGYLAPLIFVKLNKIP